MDDPLRRTTVLTHDATAHLAYVYVVPPSDHGGVCETRSADFLDANECRFSVQLDYGDNNRLLGVEFPAATKEEALARAAAVLGGIA